jgi:hypothetical protein
VHSALNSNTHQEVLVSLIAEAVIQVVRQIEQFSLFVIAIGGLGDNGGTNSERSSEISFPALGARQSFLIAPQC